MRADAWHWLDYDPIALVVLITGFGLLLLCLSVI